MTGGRDPLSVRYDGAASRFVSRAVAADGKWVETTVAPPSQRIVGWALARGIDPMMLRHTGPASGIENLHEAAFRRACYWDDRVYLWDKHGGNWNRADRPRNPHRVAALEFRWGRRTVAGRMAKVRVHPIRAKSGYGAKLVNPWTR
jgi:hypothetical protein